MGGLEASKHGEEGGLKGGDGEMKAWQFERKVEMMMIIMRRMKAEKQLVAIDEKKKLKQIQNRFDDHIQQNVYKVNENNKMFLSVFEI